MNWKDLSEKIVDTCIKTFSESVEIHYLNVDIYDIEPAKGVYDSSYQQVDMQTGASISSTAPMIEFTERHLPKKITTKDKIKARGILYKVKEIQNDETGALKVYLIRS